MRPVLRIILFALLVAAAWTSVRAQSPSPVDTRSLSEMRWRMIGPHRASRTKAVDGIAGQPHTFFIGVVNGGVWKTTDAGRTWQPIFDDQPTGSIGSIAVAPSRPTVIYVGTGEGQQRPDLATGDGRLQDHRRRQDLGASGSARHAANRAHHRRSEEPRSALRRGARPSVRTESGARHLSLARRRPDIPESPVQGRKHRRLGRHARSKGSQHRLRDAVGGASGPLGKRRFPRPR